MTDTTFTNSTGNSEPSTSQQSPVVSLLWRLILVTGGALGIAIGTALVSEWIWGPEMSLPKHITTAVGMFLLAVPLVVVVRRFLDRRPISTLGFTRGVTAWRDLLYGAATWLLPAAIGLTIALGAGWLHIEIEATAAELIGVVVLLIALVFVNEAFPEELIFRGYIYRNLVARLVPWVAIGVQAVIFAAWGTTLWVVSHGWEVLGERLLIFFGGGIAIGCLRQVSRSLWAPIGFHLAFQVVMQLFAFSQYIDIDVSSDQVFTLATAVVAFVTVTMVASLLWRGTPNWTTPEPDQPADQSSDPAS